MDGIAISSIDVKEKPSPFRLEVRGVSFAGHGLKERISSNLPGCIRVYTGAEIPDIYDTVVPLEDCKFSYDDKSAREIVNLSAKPPVGSYIREVGNDVLQGAILLEKNAKLNPFRIASLTSAGISKVKVFTRPRISIFSTGDELQEPGRRLKSGQIYDTNRLSLKLLLAKLPAEIADLGILPDNPQEIQSTLSAAAETSDLLISSAGASVGAADYVTPAIRELGDLKIWKVNIKPGRPLAFGRIKNAHFFGLPGNPVSALITFLIICRPAILKLCGLLDNPVVYNEAILQNNITHNKGREEFQRGKSSYLRDNLIVEVTGDQSSNRLSSFREANCLIQVSKNSGDLSPGTKVKVISLENLI